MKRFFLSLLGEELYVLLCAMLPVIELRGASPLGAALGLHPVLNYILSVVGNLLPVPFILLFVRRALLWLGSFERFAPAVAWLERRAEAGRGKVEKFAVMGLAIFVAIPLPGTGAWTGALVAALAGMRFPKALISIVVGVLAAGVVVSLVSYGVVAVFEWM